MTYRCVSSKVFKRFPTFQHLVDAGIMENEEKILVEQAQKKSEFLAYCHWMPFSWASSLTFQAYQNGHIKKDLYNWDIQKEIVIVKDFCNAIISYDWINIPLVYTQVVTIGKQRCLNFGAKNQMSFSELQLFMLTLRVVYLADNTWTPTKTSQVVETQL